MDEYISLVCDALKTFRKESYSSIAKKMKRFGKQQEQYARARSSEEYLKKKME